MINVPESQETGTSEALVLSSDNFDAISIDDPAAAGMQVTLSVGEGALTLADTTSAKRSPQTMPRYA